MLGVCMRYVKDPAQAEDIMLAGFMKAFEKMGQFRQAGSLEGWIRRIMVNESLACIRKTSRMFVADDIRVLETHQDCQVIDCALETEDLMAMVRGLPDGYRAVFNLYAIEGYSHQEIAQQLGISENTSKSQLSRARALLRKHLNALGEVSKKKSIEKV